MPRASGCELAVDWSLTRDSGSSSPGDAPDIDPERTLEVRRVARGEAKSPGAEERREAMEAAGAARSSAAARLSPAASTGRLKLEETCGSFARVIVGDGSGVAEASSVAATGPTPLLSRNHRTIYVLFRAPGKRRSRKQFSSPPRGHTLVGRPDAVVGGEARAISASHYRPPFFLHRCARLKLQSVRSIPLRCRSTSAASAAHGSTTSRTNSSSDASRKPWYDHGRVSSTSPLRSW